MNQLDVRINQVICTLQEMQSQCANLEDFHSKISKENQFMKSLINTSTFKATDAKMPHDYYMKDLYIQFASVIVENVNC